MNWLKVFFEVGFHVDSLFFHDLYDELEDGLERNHQAGEDDESKRGVVERLCFDLAHFSNSDGEADHKENEEQYQEDPVHYVDRHEGDQQKHAHKGYDEDYLLDHHWGVDDEVQDHRLLLQNLRCGIGVHIGDVLHVPVELQSHPQEQNDEYFVEGEDFQVGQIEVIESGDIHPVSHRVDICASSDWELRD